jgi:hypothetical protein
MEPSRGLAIEISIFIDSMTTSVSPALTAVHVAAGDQVERGVVLIELTDEEASAETRPGDDFVQREAT